jgi:hypothetical protein
MRRLTRPAPKSESKRRRSHRLAALLGLFMVAVFSCPAVRSQPTNRYQKLYQNDTYAYSVTLPPGTTAIGSTAPNPNHGFTVPLHSNAAPKVYESIDSYLWVDAFYVPADGVDNLFDAVKYNVRTAASGLGASLKIREEGEASLAGVKARHVISDFDAHGTQMVDEELVAIREGFMYTIGLRTTLRQWPADHALFEQIVSGFKALPLPK